MPTPHPPASSASQFGNSSSDPRAPPNAAAASVIRASSASQFGNSSSDPRAPRRLMIAAPLRVSAPQGASSGFRFGPSSSSSSSGRNNNRIRCAAAAPAAALYEELGLRAGATAREIKAAYRRLARERHPDVAGAPAAADFVRLHHAYATLSDPDTLARYDRAAVAVAVARGPRPRWGGSGSGRPRRTWETDQCW